MSKIADLTCKIMRNFLFPMYSSLYFCTFIACDLRQNFDPNKTKTSEK